MLSSMLSTNPRNVSSCKRRTMYDTTSDCCRLGSDDVGTGGCGGSGWNRRRLPPLAAVVSVLALPNVARSGPPKVVPSSIRPPPPWTRSRFKAQSRPQKLMARSTERNFRTMAPRLRRDDRRTRDERRITSVLSPPQVAVALSVSLLPTPPSSSGWAEALALPLAAEAAPNRRTRRRRARTSTHPLLGTAQTGIAVPSSTPTPAPRPMPFAAARARAAAAARRVLDLYRSHPRSLV
mmetsp:Transcript_12698/g.26905  ORF Transcript_12698/g.26905 Transcript_12698/m.26905 type:complete len:236 (-) Transcript_12698:28-735(-)